MESSTCSSGERVSSREGEQASYFYVVWPEETVTTLSAAAAVAGGTLDPTLCGHTVHRPTATRPHRHPLVPQSQVQSQSYSHPQTIMDHAGHPSTAPPPPPPPPLSPPGKPLPEIEVVGSFASPLTSPILSIADTSPLVTQSSVQAFAKDLEKRIETGSTGDERESSRSRLSCEPTTSQPNSPRLTSICHNSLPGSSALLQTSMSGGDGAGKVKACTGQGNGSCSGDPGSVPYNLQDHDPISNRRKRSRMHYYNINGCLECEVKDAEIKTLRRRIQVMEEVVGLLNQKLSALQQSSNGVLFSPMVMPPVVSQVVIPTSYSTPPTTSIKVHTPVVTVESSNHCGTMSSPQVSSDTEDASSDSASIAYAQAELCPPAEQKVELLPGTGVYVTLPQLEEARRESKNGTQLARKLMDAFWDRETLARSSLSSKSKYQYQQLDPNVISAIEAYCLNFDSGTHSRDLHACMTDKCCQARSRRGAPYKALQNGLLQNGVVHNGLHGSMNGT